MAQTTGQKLTAALVYSVLIWIISFWTAFIVMVLEGAVASNLGFRTLGYWTTYLIVMLLTSLGGIWNRDVTYFLAKND